MKKSLFVLLSVCVVFSFAACKTTATQEQVNAAFEQVYNKYRNALIMDGAKSYTVVKGDTLSGISKKFYPDYSGYYFPVIMLASNTSIPDPDLIEPGMKLTIPDLKLNLNNAASKAKIKAYLMEIANIYQKKDNEATRKALQDLSNSL